MKRPRFPSALFGKIGKVIICLVLAFVFTYAKPKQEVEAGWPIVAAVLWDYVVYPMLISIAIEEGKKLGIKFIDKIQAKKHAKEIIDKAKGKIKDTDIKQTLDKNSKKIKFTVSAGVIALITFLWGEYIDDHKTTKGGTDYSGAGRSFGDIDDGRTIEHGYVLEKIDGEYQSSHPLYNTQVHINVVPYNNDQFYARSVDFFKKAFNIVITPIPFAQRSKVEFKLMTNNEVIKTLYVKGGSTVDLLAYFQQYPNQNSTGFEYAFAYMFDNDHDFLLAHNNIISNDKVYVTEVGNHYASLYRINNQNNYYATNDAGYGMYPSGILVHNVTYNRNSTIAMVRESTPAMRNMVRLYMTYLTNLANANRTFVYADGLHVEDNVKYIKYPGDIPEDLNSLVTVLNRIGVTVNNKDIEYDLSDIQGLDTLDLTNDEHLPQLQIEQKTDNLIVIDENDLIPIVNPPYELTKEKEDIINQIIIEINNGGVPGGGGTVQPIDQGLIAYVRNSYDYATNAITTGVQGIQSLTTGLVGMSALIGSVFAYLPPEILTFVGSAFIITAGLWVFKK